MFTKFLNNNITRLNSIFTFKYMVVVVIAVVVDYHVEKPSYLQIRLTISLWKIYILMR